MDEKNNRRNDGQLQLELPQEVAMGEYANFAIITHSSSDFIVDFARVMPGLPKAQVRSRVILAPEHAKRLLAALQENIMRYENEFGPIRIPNKNAPDIVPPFSRVTVVTVNSAWVGGKKKRALADLQVVVLCHPGAEHCSCYEHGSHFH